VAALAGAAVEVVGMAAGHVDTAAVAVVANYYYYYYYYYAADCYCYHLIRTFIMVFLDFIC
jgi:hypothetical protein